MLGCTLTRIVSFSILQTLLNRPVQIDIADGKGGGSGEKETWLFVTSPSITRLMLSQMTMGVAGVGIVGGWALTTAQMETGDVGTRMSHPSTIGTGNMIAGGESLCELTIHNEGCGYQ